MLYQHLYLYFLQHECKLWAKAQQVQTISQNNAIYQKYISIISCMHHIGLLYLDSSWIMFFLVWVLCTYLRRATTESAGGATQILHKSMIQYILYFGPLMWTSSLPYKCMEEVRIFHPPRMHKVRHLDFWLLIHLSWLTLKSHY